MGQLDILFTENVVVVVVVKLQSLVGFSWVLKKIIKVPFKEICK